jgi:hypothetical protein
MRANTWKAETLVKESLRVQKRSVGGLTGERISGDDWSADATRSPDPVVYLDAAAKDGKQKDPKDGE